MTTIACLMLCIAPIAEDGADTVVVCPTDFREAIQPWIEYRSRQGHRIQVVASDLDAARIRQDILEIAKEGRLQHVVLVGDVPPEAWLRDQDQVRGPRGVDIIETRREQARARYVPTFFVAAKVNVQFGSSAEIATDIGYSDLDEDGLPDLSIGRLPVDTPEQLRNLVRRIIVYENRFHADYSARRVNILAEPGNFGAIADSILEMTAKRFIRSGIPASYDIHTTFANSRSPFCPDPRELNSSTIERLNEGSLFWVYIGHGQSWYLHPMRHANRWFPLFEAENVDELSCISQSPIAVFFCCFTGAFDRPEDCLAEQMVNAEGGPIASFAATRVTMPFAMTVMADALLREHFGYESETLGELILRSKRAATRPVDDDDDPRQWMYQLATIFSPTRDMLDDELRENNALYNLLGDPLLRLAKPNEIELDIPERVVAGEALTIEGNLPNPGRVTFELVYRRDRILNDARARDLNSITDEEWNAWQAEYEQANERVVRYEVVDMPSGDFNRSLFVPSFAKGACHVRVYVQHEQGFDLGASDIFVKASSSALRQTRRESATIDQR